MTFFTLRGGLPHSYRKFTREKTGRVACLGGSITVATGWRDRIWEFLRKTFPETTLDFINAGIGGTDSSLGAFRLETDVFKNGPVDLFFVEFAVNDGGKEGPEPVRAMEGIVRHARRLNPEIDIVFSYFIDTDKLNMLNEGKTPPIIAAHDRVAAHYNIPAINLAEEMARRIRAGEFTWEQFSGDTCHPSPFGHTLYAECMMQALTAAWSLPRPLDGFNYENGRFISTAEARIIRGFAHVRQWDPGPHKCNYGGPIDVLAAEEPGAELRLNFTGSTIGIYGIVGFDAGTIDYRLDGGPITTRDLFDSWCLKFHRPHSLTLAAGLAPGPHELTITVSPTKNAQSLGHAVRILQFMAS